MKYFLILLIISLSYIVNADDKIFIVARVNQTPITNVDVERRISLLKYFVSDILKFSAEQRQQIAVQGLVQDALKNEYIRRSNITFSESDKKNYAREVFDNMKKIDQTINIEQFVRENSDFVETEILWKGVIQTKIMPSVKVTDEMVAEVKNKKPEMSEAQIKHMIAMEQVYAYTMQILNSMKQMSVIEFNQG